MRNLLRSPAKFSAFGLPLDAEQLRSAFLALVWIVVAASATAAVEEFRLHRLEADLAERTAQARTNDARRNDVRKLSLEVARLQDVRNSANALRESGNDAALQIARAGNAVPDGVWLDRLSSDGFRLQIGGESLSLEAAGSTAASLEHAFPNGRAILTDLHRRDDQRYVFATELELNK